MPRLKCNWHHLTALMREQEANKTASSLGQDRDTVMLLWRFLNDALLKICVRFTSLKEKGFLQTKQADQTVLSSSRFIFHHISISKDIL